MFVIPVDQLELQILPMSRRFKDPCPSGDLYILNAAYSSGSSNVTGFHGLFLGISIAIQIEQLGFDDCSWTKNMCFIVTVGFCWFSSDVAADSVGFPLVV